jgi:Condensation domain
MDQLAVTFRADDDGTFPMTWGQQDFWRHKIRRYADSEIRNFNIPVVVDLTDEAGLTDQPTVAAALRRLVERNQSLRAYFSDSPGGLIQRVVRSGTFTLRIRQSTPAAARAGAQALAAELAERPFDHEAEWGVRFALICSGQSTRHVVFAISHLLVDGGGVMVLIEDLLGLLRARGEAAGEPERRWQPSDQAGRESSERGARRTRAAIRHWRKHLERIPPSMFAVAGAAGQPRFRGLRMDSRALARAATRLAAECQVSVSSTVLAAAAAALTALSGQPTCVLVLVVGNRYDEEIRGMLGPASQDGLFAIDLPGGTIADAVRATHRAATIAYFSGHYDPVAIEDLVDQVTAERGVRFDLTLLYNDLSAFADQAGDGGLPATEADARKLLGETVIVPERTWEGQLCKMYLAVVPGADNCRLTLVGDTAYLPLDCMRALLRGIEKIVFEAAYRDVEVAEVPALTGLTPSLREGAHRGP